MKIILKFEEQLAPIETSEITIDFSITLRKLVTFSSQLRLSI